jgi:hypothetical protein
MTKPLYFYNGSTFELIGPTTPQSPIAYQTSAPTAPATGDLWIDSDGDVDTYNRQLTRYYFVATAAQTTITGIDANGLTLAYVAGSEAVYVNGALQVRGQDYTATNGTSVVMSSGLAVNDVVEIFAYTAFTVANAYTKSETDGIAAAAAGMRLVVPTSVAVGSGSGSVGTSGTVTFSGASSVSLNGCFTSIYDNYKILINISSASASSSVFMRLRASGTDNSGATVYQRSGYASTPSSLSNSYAAASSWFVGALNNGVSQKVPMEILDPFKTIATAGYLTTFDQPTNNSNGLNMVHIDGTSFDGFTLFTGTGTITGTVSVYGYKD